MADPKEVRIVWKEGTAFDGKDGRGLTIPMADDPRGSSPMDLLLISLGGCTAMDIISILQKMRQPVEAFEIVVRGQRAETYPRKYTHITLEYVLHGKIEARAVEDAIELSEKKYCSVMGTLDPEVMVETGYRIVEGE